MFNVPYLELFWGEVIPAIVRLKWDEWGVRAFCYMIVLPSLGQTPSQKHGELYPLMKRVVEVGRQHLITGTFLLQFIIFRVS